MGFQRSAVHRQGYMVLADVSENFLQWFSNVG